MRTVHIIDNGEERIIKAKGKYQASMIYNREKHNYDDVWVEDECGEFVDETEL